MWKANFQRAIAEVRITIHPDPKFHGLARFVETRVPVLRQLSPNTFFGISELTSEYKTPGYVSIIFRNPQVQAAWIDLHKVEGKIPAVPDIVPGDKTEEDLTVVEGDDQSDEWWEKTFKDLVAFGLAETDDQEELPSNKYKALPMDFVEAFEYSEMHDNF